MQGLVAQTGLTKHVPILGWLPKYPREWLRFDLVAGLTAAAVVIPQAMAYATIAGLPVEVGLYTALMPMLVYALLGTSRPLSVSATSTIAMLTATELARVVQSAVIMSILALLYYAGHPPVYVVGRKPGTDVFRPVQDHAGDETFPGLLMLRTEGMMFFASAPQALGQMTGLIREHQPQIVVLDCSAVPNFEYTALKEFSEYDDKLRTSGIGLWLAALNREAFQAIELAPLGKSLGHERMFFNLEQAVEAYQGMQEITS